MPDVSCMFYIKSIWSMEISCCVYIQHLETREEPIVVRHMLMHPNKFQWNPLDTQFSYDYKKRSFLCWVVSHHWNRFITLIYFGRRFVVTELIEANYKSRVKVCYSHHEFKSWMCTKLKSWFILEADTKEFTFFCVLVV